MRTFDLVNQKSAGLVALLVACAAPQANAQAVILGRVTSDSGRRALPNAEIFVDGGSAARADSTGAFRLVVARGALTLQVRAVGHQPLVRRIDVSGDSVQLDVTLVELAQQLDSVNVRGQAPVISPRMLGFEQRRKEPFGKFFTREQLAERESTPLSNVLRLANLTIIQRGFGSGAAVATGRGGSLPTRAGGRSICYATVYLDGVVLWAPGQGAAPNIDQFKVQDLEAIEIYRSALETPLQFRAPSTQCGAVVLWTRVGGSKE